MLETAETIFDPRTHNGYITVKSTSGSHRTYQIRTAKSGPLEGKRILALLTGPNRDDFTNWTGFAFVDEHGINVWRSKRVSTDGDLSVWMKHAQVLIYVTMYENKGFEYLYSSKCRVCNRELTEPTSIKSGIGPVCAGR